MRIIKVIAGILIWLFIISLLLTAWGVITLPEWTAYIYFVPFLFILIFGPLFLLHSDAPKITPTQSRFCARPYGNGRIIVETSEHPYSPSLRNDLSHPLFGSREFTYDGETTHMEINVKGDSEVAAAVAEAQRTIRRTGHSNNPFYRDAMSFLLYQEGNGDLAKYQPGYPSLEKRRHWWAVIRGE